MTTRDRTRLSRGDALLLIDVLNPLDFAGGERVLPWAERLVAPLQRVARAARRAGLPVIYINDHHGVWTGERSEIVRRCTRPAVPGREVSQQLAPRRGDLFLIKPRHSAFFATSLALLLEELKVRRLVLTGIATNLCVLMTAHDAVMNGYRLLVLSDCCAAESDFDHNAVLGQLKRYFRAVIRRGDEVLPKSSGPVGK